MKNTISNFVPDEWLIGIVKPIYKNKGDPISPENYRPITLLSCLSKLFTSILNNRLEAYATEVNLINENQTGFRKKSFYFRPCSVITIFVTIFHE
jgi:hypothetical protein